MPANKSARVDEFKSKPSKLRIAAMRIIWGDEPITAPRARKKPDARAATDQNVWLVPSEKTSQRYTVNLARKTCTCPYWRDRRTWCKHLEAARIWKAKVQLDEEPPVAVGLESVPNPYKQEPWYDALSAREEEIVRELARCLGAHFGVVRSENRKSNAGVPGYAVGDFLACGIVAGYLNRPSRKAIPIHAVQTSLVRGGRAPSPPALRAAMRRPALRDAARRAQRMVAMCTSKVDTVFSLDGTVMKTPLSRVHLQRAAGGKKKVLIKILNCKVHLAIGIETFVVYGVHVVDGDESDQRGFVPTMDQFVDFVRLDAVLADAGYDASNHYEYVGERGGTPYIDFSDIPGRGPMEGKGHYNRALAKWKADDDEWTQAYAHRWLSESANSSLKRTIKRVIRARYEETREVEVLMATLAFSLKWLAHARAKHGVDIPWADAKALALIDEVVERCRGRRKKRTEEEAA
jgi:Transposase DDE domain/SWIM zinc finger